MRPGAARAGANGAGAGGGGTTSGRVSASASAAAAAAAAVDDDDERAYDDIEEGLDAAKTARLQRAGAVPGHSTRPSLASKLARALGVRSGTARVVLAAAVSVAWMVCSNLLILVNKHILKDMKFP